LKTFFIGLVLGLAAAAGALYAFPAVDQYREPSIISVAPNGGMAESFHINIPTDRIMLGAAAQSSPLPKGLVWPADELLLDVRTELFKIRNARDAVIGIASRTAVQSERSSSVEWVIHLPARGSMFVMMNNEPLVDGYRSGSLRAGSREFDALIGSMTERWIADQSDDELLGRIELQAAYVSIAEPLE
jgi:hypothetical protein